jgi:mono/diheme cytochrome c family protein
MKRDFKSCMLYALFGLPIFLLLFIGVIYFANCGFSTDCSQASLPGVIHTPIPTLIFAAISSQGKVVQVEATAPCAVTARDLLAAWVNAGYQENLPFDFRDTTGNICQATFTDVLPLFTEANIWYKGALACDSCHSSDSSVAAANLDMSSYTGILAGGKRTPPSGQGEDILGGGNWENSLLYQMLFVTQIMPFGHPLGGVAPDGPIIQAGTIANTPIILQTEAPPEEEVARPSNPGASGEAIYLTGDATAGQKVYVGYCQVCHGVNGGDGISNPGSDDGTMPPVNPIDSSLVSPDYKTYAYNLDLFIQNGSVPAGVNPAFQMPAWGVNGALTQRQIADVIAYIISINK